MAILNMYGVEHWVSPTTRTSPGGMAMAGPVLIKVIKHKFYKDCETEVLYRLILVLQRLLNKICVYRVSPTTRTSPGGMAMAGSVFTKVIKHKFYKDCETEVLFRLILVCKDC